MVRQLLRALSHVTLALPGSAGRDNSGLLHRYSVCSTLVSVTHGGLQQSRCGVSLRAVSQRAVLSVSGSKMVRHGRDDDTLAMVLAGATPRSGSQISLASEYRGGIYVCYVCVADAEPLSVRVAYRVAVGLRPSCAEDFERVYTDISGTSDVGYTTTPANCR